jgi:hypothetical protein
MNCGDVWVKAASRAFVLPPHFGAARPARPLHS